MKQIQHLSGSTAPTISRLTIVAALTCLTACGGGGGSSSSASAQSVSGTVAVGAPMESATVTVMDVHGLTKTVQAAADGSYSGLDLTGLTGPFRLQACGLVDGHSACFYSTFQSPGTANVTPLTDAAVALALNGDAADLFSGASAPDSATLEAKKQAIQAALAPVLAAAGLSPNTDISTVQFSANRTGMDKVLDAVKVTTGSDGGVAFAQLEGVVGSGNFFVDSSGSTSGGLSAGSLATNMSVDLSGISSVFAAMSQAVGQASQSACTNAMNGAGIFDPAFSMDMDGNLLTASTAPAMMCQFAASQSLLGGRVANPVLRDCDFSGSDKVCEVGFDIILGDTAFEGAELAVVQRSGTTAWRLLGQESPYEIHVSAAVQRTTRVDVANPTPHYTRALSFDIKSSVAGVANAVRAAKVYQHDVNGTGWDSTPLATLNDSGCSSSQNLTMQGSSCGSSWLSLDSFSSGSLADGDAMIDAFYHRGREVKIELYSDTAATALIATVVKRVDGVPPKAADLAKIQWLELDTAGKAALTGYDSASSSAALTVTWLGNHAVSAHDLTVCNSPDCASRVQADISTQQSASNSKAVDVSSLSLTASGYKQVQLYGRDREQMGISSNFVSCQTGSMGCPAP